jgi:hypothetical protein
MMLKLWFGALALVAVLFCAAPRASAATVVTDNPALYAQGLADGMALTGMRALREAYRDLVGDESGAVPANIESSLLVYERAIGSRTAIVSRVVDDVVLSNTLRTIYIYHYFGESAWVFTRIDFHSIGEGRWAVAALSFADQWRNVAIQTTPGFRLSPPSR